MNCKIGFIFLVSFLLIQISLAEDVKPEEAKSGFDDLKDKVSKLFTVDLKMDKVWEDLTTNLKSLGEKIGTGSKDFVKTIQDGSNTLFNKDNKEAE